MDSIRHFAETRTLQNQYINRVINDEFFTIIDEPNTSKMFNTLITSEEIFGE